MGLNNILLVSDLNSIHNIVVYISQIVLMILGIWKLIELIKRK